MFSARQFRPYFRQVSPLPGCTNERSFSHAQAFPVSVLRALCVHPCVQSVLDGPAPRGAALFPCRVRDAAGLRHTQPGRAGTAGVGGHLAVYTCKPDGTPDALQEVTDIYVNLLPENDALRIKRGFTVTGDRALDRLLEDLGG